MRPIVWIALGLAAFVPHVLLAASAGAVPSERELREECSAFPEAGMRDCLAKKFDESQRLLRQAEREAASALSGWDEDQKYVAVAKLKLAHSNSAFAKYRQAQCDFLSSLNGGGVGNAQALRRLACLAELDNLRAVQLRDAISGLPPR